MLARVAAAVGAGVLLYVSFPPRPFWWLALPALAVLGLLVYGRRAKAAFGYGFLFGMGFLLPLLTWIGSLVGPVPWVALVVLESLFVGLGGAGMALVSPAARRPGVVGRGLGRERGAAGARAVGWAAVGTRRVRAARRSRCSTSRRSVASRCCRSSRCWPGSRSASWCAARWSGGAQVGRRVAPRPNPWLATRPRPTTALGLRRPSRPALRPRQALNLRLGPPPRARAPSSSRS